MSPAGSSASEIIQAGGWRQGSVVCQPGITAQILKRSVERDWLCGEPHCGLIVITQDCDLVQDVSVEPFVEFMGVRRIFDLDPLCINGRNPRLLHLQWSDEQKNTEWIGLSIHDRFRVRKETLANLTASATKWLALDDVRLLTRWVARRYTRPAFPDTFNLRLKTVESRLERLFKSKEGRVVSGIFIDVDDTELSGGEPYEISVRITARAETWNTGAKLRALEDFEQRLSSILDDCQGISIANDDILTLPEGNLTLADLRRFMRLDKDYRSMPERAGVERLVDRSGEL